MIIIFIIYYLTNRSEPIRSKTHQSIVYTVGKNSTLKMVVAHDQNIRVNSKTKYVHTRHTYC